jgi:predicted Zn-dependent protease
LYGFVSAPATAGPPKSLESFYSEKVERAANRPFKRDSTIRYFVFLDDTGELNLRSKSKSVAFGIMQKAIMSWSRVLPINFVMTDRAEDANFVITIEEIGDPSALADTTLGPPIPGEQLRLSLNIRENWDATEHKLEATVCHEIGHILGIRHEDVKGEGQLMNPILNDRIWKPQAEDIAVARRIWGI